MAYVVQRQYSINEFILHQSLNPEHELMQLAAKIDWEAIADRLRKYYKIRGRRAKHVRLTCLQQAGGGAAPVETQRQAFG